MTGFEDPDRLAPSDVIAAAHSGLYRFVGGDESVGMQDRHHRTPRDIARMTHDPGSRGNDRGTGRGAQVDAAMAL